MATQILSAYELHGNTPRTCENCNHWQMNGPVYAYQGNIPVLVGQCRAAETTHNEAAPFAETGFVFTQSHNSCGAFELHPDVIAFHADMAAIRFEAYEQEYFSRLTPAAAAMCA
jgi:hypothetical protein